MSVSSPTRSPLISPIDYLPLLQATPAGLAYTLTGGSWLPARHLLTLSRKLVDVVSGRMKRLIVEMPPRHGKSWLCSQWFPIWCLNQHPEWPILLASYEADFAASWGRAARNLIAAHGAGLRVRVAGDSSAANRWNTPQGGGMVTAGVGGPITGKGARILLVDDPVKNAEEAASEAYRERAWEWWQSTAYTRLEPGGGAIVVQTRWHEDDLAGRLIAQSDAGIEHWEVLRLPAIAEEDDQIGRAIGEPLWPERYNAEALEQIRASVGPYVWAALYQQRPAPREGNMFKRAWFPIMPDAPAQARRVRAWDKAGTEGAGDYTAGVLMATHEGIYYIEDVVRGQWESAEREKVMRQTAELDRHRSSPVSIWLEQEPGSGGKDSAKASVMNLAGFPARYQPSSGDKVTRADPFAAQAGAGNVRVVAGDWNVDYIAELCGFPTTAHDDMVDASSLAFSKLALEPSRKVVAW